MLPARLIHTIAALAAMSMSQGAARLGRPSVACDHKSHCKSEEKVMNPLRWRLIWPVPVRNIGGDVQVPKRSPQPLVKVSGTATGALRASAFEFPFAEAKGSIR